MLSDFYGLVEDHVRDQARVISDTSRDAAIAAAVQRYSMDRAMLSVEDIFVTTAGYHLDLPDAWADGISSLKSLEYGGRIVSGDMCSIYLSPTSAKIRVPDAYPLSASQTVRVQFYAAHELDGEEDTIPLRDRHPVSCFAAAILCDQLASHYAADSDPTIAADSVNHQTKSQTWASRAKTLRDQYFKGVGVAPTPTLAAAGGTANFGQRPRFTRGLR
jgi:hypothetical protein